MTKLNFHTAAGSKVAWGVAGIVAVWFATVLTAALNGAFVDQANKLNAATPLVIIVPLIVFLGAVALNQTFREWVLGLDPGLLTALQSWRIIGIAMLVLYAFGHLPGLFAWPAGVGDVAVGVIAPFVAVALLQGRIGLISAPVIGLHVAGVVDFLSAVSIGLYARELSPGLVEGVTTLAMGQLPMVLIPTFGVPLFAILHLIVFILIWRAVRAPDAVSAAA